MKIFGICLLVVALTAPTFADDKKAKVDEDPIVFGITGQNTGCVIFRQYTEKNTKFWGVAISQSRVSALEVRRRTMSWRRRDGLARTARTS